MTEGVPVEFADVLEIEESFWQSSGDQDFYETHVADSGRFVLSMGVLDKRDVVDAMGQADPWASYEMSDPTFVPIEDGVVGLLYEATGKRTEDAEEYRAHILSVYQAKDGDWQLVLHQQTPLEGN